MDYAVFRALNSLAVHGGAAFDAVVRFLANDGVVVFPLALVVLWIVPGRSAHRVRTAAVVSAVAVLGALLLNQAWGHLVHEARPFVAHRGQVDQLIAHSADNSFPSDHTAVGFGAAAGLWAARRWLAATLGVWALLVGLARVVAGLHYPIDILVGALDGIAAAALVLWLLRAPLDRLTGFGERVYGRLISPLRAVGAGSGRGRAGA